MNLLIPVSIAALCPNPILGDPKRDDMFINGIKCVSASGKVKSSIRFSEVF